MKLLPLAVAAATLFAVTSLHAQGTTLTKRLRTTKPAPPQLQPRTDGIIPRAIRSGNALQMINPAAPAEYGNGNDMVRHEPSDPSQRPQGFKLLAIEF